ncbi:TetR/AcrR family transcriptional regulator [Actinocorallia sp. A-T 12471]|uniref:TetR/AcrR family transcriptional regulator n=1 Tax=Actinocorallia sp. A-T 12471 TaxID=3089813 RepID=UPI0029CFAB26|nr:TetR/AcrR family transcriptional regulator [Actinocorallia sp. A-T 12471]MDX6741338.1 TetR/AcrR family transcriptional regulator [Actinocorallia sp. A-T 12471]
MSATPSRRDPDRRRALLEAADTVILREGPEASMASIAAEAGVSKPILYRHFGDKSGLYQTLAERHSRVLIEAIRAAMLRDAGMRERVHDGIDTYLAMISANLHFYRFLMHRARAEDTATHSVMSTVMQSLGDEIAEILPTEPGPAGAARAQVWAHAIVGMVQNAGDWWLDHPEVARAAVVESLTDLVLGGLTARRAVV